MDPVIESNTFETISLILFIDSLFPRIIKVGDQAPAKPVLENFLIELQLSARYFHNRRTKAARQKDV